MDSFCDIVDNEPNSYDLPSNKINNEQFHKITIPSKN